MSSDDNMNWVVQKMCTDVGEYELIVEKQKAHWECEQRLESWKWIVSYHGSIVANGSVNNPDEAKIRALANVPVQPGA